MLHLFSHLFGIKTLLKTLKTRNMDKESAKCAFSKLTPTFMQISSLIKKHFGEEEASKLSFPRVVIMGSKNVGKSSLLGALIGHAFTAPKKKLIATHRPIEFQFIHNKDGKFWIELNKSPKMFESFEEVQDEITSEFKFLNTGNEISSIPVKLTIHDPNMPSMTIIDLPGLVMYPEKLQVESHELTMSYIQDEQTFILAVAPANDSIYNAESLKVARAVDPLYSRTIAIITKLDLADEDEKNHLWEVFSGSVFNPKLEFFGMQPSPIGHYDKMMMCNLIAKIHKLLAKALTEQCSKKVRVLLSESLDELKALGEANLTC